MLRVLFLFLRKRTSFSAKNSYSFFELGNINMFMIIISCKRWIIRVLGDCSGDMRSTPDQLIRVRDRFVVRFVDCMWKATSPRWAPTLRLIIA